MLQEMQVANYHTVGMEARIPEQTGMWVFSSKIVENLNIENLGDGMELSCKIKIQAKKLKNIRGGDACR